MSITAEPRGDAIALLLPTWPTVTLTEQEARNLMRHLQAALYRIRWQYQVASHLPVDLSRQGREFP